MFVQRPWDVKNTLSRFNGDPEFFDTLAKFQRNYYAALLKEGFTREEAMDIVSRQPFELKF